MVGDFNEILYEKEKHGGARPHKQMNYFHEVLTNCGLKDLGYTRRKCTWPNNQLDGSFTKAIRPFCC